MMETIENWGTIIKDWAEANPLLVDALTAGIGAIIALWLLISLVRMMLPKKTRKQAEDAAAPAATSPPAEMMEAHLPPPAEPAPLETGETPEFPTVAPGFEGGPEMKEDAAPVSPTPSAAPEPVDEPSDAAQQDWLKDPQEVEAHYREALDVGFVKDVDVVEEKYRRSLHYGEAPPPPPPLEDAPEEPDDASAPLSAGAAAAPGIEDLTIAYPVESAPPPTDEAAPTTEPPVRNIVDDAPPADRVEEDGFAPGDTYGDWPYPTAPETDPRDEFPTSRPKASQTAPAVESPEEAEDGTPLIETEAQAPVAAEPVLEPEPVYTAPVVDYSDFAGAAPIEETLEEELFENGENFADAAVSEAEDDAAFEDALNGMKSRRSEEPPASAEHNVTRMRDPFGFVDETPDAKPDVVDVSVFTPKRVKPAQAFILQAIFHVEEQAPQVAAVATAIDPDAEQRVSKTLRQAVGDGQIITASLDIPDAEIDQPVQAFTWRGDIEPLQFIVTIPPQLESVSVLAKLQVALDGVPVASAVWRIVLAPDADVVNETGEYIPIQRYRRAFVSYSSKDRVEVLKRVQGLQAAGLEVFQDVLDLEPGERWSKALYKNIDDADAFYLFWSENSAASEWVAKEWRYALEKAMTDPQKRPDICPVILTAPPPMPPAELADRHFNDILAYVLKAHEAGASA